jgi:HK97 family phage prohead protease
MNPNFEMRAFTKALEIRKLEKTGFIGTLVGYAAVYATESKDFGGWREVIRPGSFTDALKDPSTDIRMLYQHNTSNVMARQSAGTLRLTEDEHGLRIEADLTDTNINRDALSDIRAGNLDAMSVGMPKVTVKATWEKKVGYDLRTINKAGLAEVSVVTWAAYEDTSIAARDYEIFQKAVRPDDSAVPIQLLRDRSEFDQISQRSS